MKWRWVCGIERERIDAISYWVLGSVIRLILTWCEFGNNTSSRRGREEICVNGRRTNPTVTLTNRSWGDALIKKGAAYYIERNFLPLYKPFAPPTTNCWYWTAVVPRKTGVHAFCWSQLAGQRTAIVWLNGSQFTWFSPHELPSRKEDEQEMVWTRPLGNPAIEAEYELNFAKRMAETRRIMWYTENKMMDDGEEEWSFRSVSAAAGRSKNL